MAKLFSTTIQMEMFLVFHHINNLDFLCNVIDVLAKSDEHQSCEFVGKLF